MKLTIVALLLSVAALTTCVVLEDWGWCAFDVGWMLINLFDLRRELRALAARPDGVTYDAERDVIILRKDGVSQQWDGEKWRPCF